MRTTSMFDSKKIQSKWLWFPKWHQFSSFHSCDPLILGMNRRFQNICHISLFQYHRNFSQVIFSTHNRWKMPRFLKRWFISWNIFLNYFIFMTRLFPITTYHPSHRTDIISTFSPNRTIWSCWKALVTENLMEPTPESSPIAPTLAGSLALPKQPTCSAQNCHRCNSTTRYYKNRQFLHNFGIFDNFMAISPYWCLGTLNIFPYPVPHHLIGFSML